MNHSGKAVIFSVILTLLLSGCQSTASSQQTSPISATTASEQKTDADISINPIASWSQERWEYSQEGSSLAMPVVSDIQVVDSSENMIRISWNAVEGADSYHIGYGHADSTYTETQADIPIMGNYFITDGHLDLYLNALNSEKNRYSEDDHIHIEFSNTLVEFEYYDGDHPDTIVNSEKCDYKLPIGNQSFDVYDGLITIGPLFLSQIPEGWHTDGNFTFEKELKEGNNKVSIFVYKTEEE